MTQLHPWMMALVSIRMPLVYAEVLVKQMWIRMAFVTMSMIALGPMTLVACAMAPVLCMNVDVGTFPPAIAIVMEMSLMS